MVEQLTWKTNFRNPFLTGNDQLTVTEDGLYFLYLQVTFESKQSYNVTVKVRDEVILSQINQNKPSTGLMGKGITLSKGHYLTVTCKPAAKIKPKPEETYLGIIKIG